MFEVTNIMDYEKNAELLKALADPNRLKIVDLLSCGTLCACDILEHFEFTQPTLSHHMKVLKDAGIVTSEKIGKWQHYTLKPSFTKELPKFVYRLLLSDENCICHQTSTSNCKTCKEA